MVAFNRTVDADTAAEINKTFVEVAVAPEFGTEALPILRQKKNIRLLQVNSQDAPFSEHRQIGGGFLVQDKDVYYLRPEELKIVSKRPPTQEEMEALLFRMAGCEAREVKRDCLHQRFAAARSWRRPNKPRRRGKWGAIGRLCRFKGAPWLPTPSFPSLTAWPLQAMACAPIIQPGGSVRDSEVIEAADAQT